MATLQEAWEFYQNQVSPDTLAGALLGEDLAYNPNAPTEQSRTADYIKKAMAILGDDIYSEETGFVDIGVPYSITLGEDGKLSPNTGGGSEGDMRFKVGTGDALGTSGASVYHSSVKSAGGWKGVINNGVVDVASLILAPATGGWSIAAAKALQAASGDTQHGADYLQAATAVGAGYFQAYMGSGTWEPPASIAEQMGLPPGTIVNLSEMTPEMIAGVTNPAIQDQLYGLASQSGSAGSGLLAGGATLPGLYDAWQNNQPQDASIPALIDQPAGLPAVEPGGAPAAGEAPQQEGLLGGDTQPAGGYTEQQLQDYWDKNPEALQAAVQENPEAFGLLGPTVPYQEDPGYNPSGSTGSGLGGELQPEQGTTPSTTYEDFYSGFGNTYNSENDMTAMWKTKQMELLAQEAAIAAGTMDAATVNAQNAGDPGMVDYMDMTKFLGHGVEYIDASTGGLVNEGGFEALPGIGTGTGTGTGPGSGGGSTSPDFNNIPIIFPTPQQQPDRADISIWDAVAGPSGEYGIQRPDYGTVEQLPLLEAATSELQRPPILPAANSGQASWEQYKERYDDPGYGGLLGAEQKRGLI